MWEYYRVIKADARSIDPKLAKVLGQIAALHHPSPREVLPISRQLVIRVLNASAFACRHRKTLNL